ncbi:hypothetical protein F5X97DRAFT_342059 [Nemania serpens]|nr:hypothetical protein F5X97DRAFT_342059 [Nemania serpens]
MDECSVPPFRQRGEPGGSAQSSQAENVLNGNNSIERHQSADHGDKGTQDGKRGRRGHRRNETGRGHRYDACQKHKSQADQSDLYRHTDIRDYYWGGEGGARGSLKSTLRDSKAEPGKLSHVLLFVGANPPWVHERIVFAKSNLSALPEYAERKAEHGEWETAETTHETSGAENKDAFASVSAIHRWLAFEDTTTSAGTQVEISSEQAASVSAPLHDVSILDLDYMDIRNKFEQQIFAAPRPSIAPIDYAPTDPDPAPIAVFEEQHTPGRRPGRLSARFAFKGWFRVSRVSVLAPGSDELERMLARKRALKHCLGRAIPPGNRRVFTWPSSPDPEWAVVRFEPVEGAAAPPPPQIKKATGSEPPVGDDVWETRRFREIMAEIESEIESNGLSPDELNVDITGGSTWCDLNVEYGFRVLLR